MKRILIPVLICLLACNNRNQNPSNSSSNTLTNSTDKHINAVDTLKKLNDIKMALLDARTEKANIFLGEPDKTGTLVLGRSEYRIYYNRVNDGEKVKNLVLIIGDSNGDYANYTIKDIMAVSYGARAHYGYHWIKLEHGRLTSNCTTFTIDN
ncbi:hypothetical protein [Pedobacter sp. FW305-3-2-15-E-R2A2]|uniref:hypothetical protein n=1 Tax=Pedobacter sp. FW305-3-2-15-E-R2A2 TaxID=3140251 RepID=UPI0031406EAB